MHEDPTQNEIMHKPLMTNEQYADVDRGTQSAIALRHVLTPRQTTSDPPFVVHLTRMAAGFTLIAGILMMIASAPTLGVAIVLLSALYFALAEIINYLAIIARNSEAAHRFFNDEREEDFRDQREMAGR